MSRLVIVPDERFEPLTLELKTRLLAIANELRAEHLIGLVGEQAAHLSRDVAGSREQNEMLVWGKSSRSYVVAWTSVPDDQEIVGAATAQLDQGLVSQVFKSVRPDMKAAEELNAGNWTNLENKRGRAIGGMACHPLVLFGRCVAVLTLVRYLDGEKSAELNHEDAVQVAAASSLLNRLIEDRLIRSCLGLETL